MKKDILDNMLDDDNVFGKAENAEYTLDENGNQVSSDDDTNRQNDQLNNQNVKDNNKANTLKPKNDLVSNKDSKPVISDVKDKNNQMKAEVKKNDFSTIAKHTNVESRINIKFHDEDSHTNRIMTLQGAVGENATDVIETKINQFINQGYEIASPLNSVVYQKEPQTVEITLKHKITDITRKKEIKQTVEFSMSDGTEAPDPVINQLTITEKGTQDNVTNHKTWKDESVTKSFPTVTIPHIPGYTPDSEDIKQSVHVDLSNFNDDLNLYTLVNYVIDQQTIILKIIDKTTNDIKQKEYHGLTNQVTSITTKGITSQYEQKNYRLILDETEGKPLIYDDQTDHDQVYVLEFKHGIQELTLDNPINKLNSRNYTNDLHRVLKRTISFEVPHSSKDPIIQKVEFTRKGYVDLVTGNIDYSKWTPECTYPEFTIPDIKGYTHHDNAISRKTINVNSHDELVTVNYQAVKQTIDLVFFDKTVNQKFDSVLLTGETNSKPTYDFEKAFITLKDAGYNICNKDYKDLIFDPNIDNQTYTVKLTHNTRKLTLAESINPNTNKDMQADLQKHVERKIEFIVSDKVRKPADIIQSLDFVRDDIVDLVTGEDKFTPWRGQSYYPSAIVPIIPGYDPDAKKISKQESNYQDATITVEYEPHLYTVKVIVKDIVTKTVLQTKELSARTDENINDENHFNLEKIINNYEQDGYKLISNDYNLITMPANPADEYLVLLGHKTQEIDISNPVNPVTHHNMENSLTKKDLFTIKYQAYSNEKIMAPDKQYTDVFHRVGKVDLVTGNANYGEWEEDKELPIIESPKIEDYDSLADIPNSQPNEAVDLKKAKSNIVFVKYYYQEQTLNLKFLDQNNKVIKEMHDTVTFLPVKHTFDLKSAINELIKQGYGVNHKDYPQKLIYDQDKPKIRNYTYHLHETYTVKTNAKNIVRKILIENPNGSVRVISQVSRITQKVEISNVTKKVTKGKWTKNIWDSFVPSRLKGYEANIPRIDQKIVDYNTKAETVNVKYNHGYQALGHTETAQALNQKKDLDLRHLSTTKITPKAERKIDLGQKDNTNNNAKPPLVKADDKKQVKQVKEERNVGTNNNSTINSTVKTTNINEPKFGSRQINLQNTTRTDWNSVPVDIKEDQAEHPDNDRQKAKKQNLWNTLKGLFK